MFLIFFDILCDCKMSTQEKTRMCKFGYNCSRNIRNQCNFAHSKDELVILKCLYGYQCTNPRCTYSHPQMCKFGNDCKKKNCKNIHPQGFVRKISPKHDEEGFKITSLHTKEKTDTKTISVTTQNKFQALQK